MVILSGFLLVGCDSIGPEGAVDANSNSEDPPDPVEDPGVLSVIDIAGPDVVVLEEGESSRLSIVALDQYGDAWPIDEEPLWSAGNPARADVDGSGLVTAGSEIGHSRVYVELDGKRDSIAVWNQKSASRSSTFDINLHFSERVPDEWKEEFKIAERNWERIIRESLAAVDVDNHRPSRSWTETPPDSFFLGIEDGVRIWIHVSDSFSGQHPAATGGPASTRGLPYPTTVVAGISLNSKTFDDGIDAFRMTHVAHHEMGHALGLVGLISGQSPLWLDWRNTRYRGTYGLYGYYLDFGVSVQVIEYLAGSHWPFHDVMSARTSRITHTTIGALIDLGYHAAFYEVGRIWN